MLAISEVVVLLEGNKELSLAEHRLINSDKRRLITKRTGIGNLGEESDTLCKISLCKTQAHSRTQSACAGTLSNSCRFDVA